MPARNILSVRPARHLVEVRRDVRIPTAEPGVTLSADVFRPADAGPVPALLTILPYRKDAGAGLANGPTAHWFAERGCASVLVDFRGTGSSDGRQRPPFDPGEADDGVAAVAWAAEQPWCNGNVGMWGHSYGAILSLRTAGRKPPALKAIMPVMGMLDPELDFVHPGGRRGGLGSLGQWGLDTFLNQLLPPVNDYGSEVARRRWRERLHTAEPWVLDLFRHQPEHPVWRRRVVDPELISVPSFVVAGWRDLFCDATIRAYERIGAPKKLLAGPWMHTTPEASPFDPVEFRVLALRWWQHWLSGLDTGLMDEPPVTVYRQGASPGWQSLDSWPPAHRDEVFATEGDPVLRPGPGSCAGVIAEGGADPTAGALSGLWGLPTSGFGLPLDQHDDDLRSLTFTSAPLRQELVIAGRPTVTVRGEVSEATARLCDVDEQDRSTLISAGAPTCYAVRAGHRLRISVGTADFPRLWPVTAPGLRVRGVAVTLPVIDEFVPAELPVPEPVPAAGEQRPVWTVTRDLIDDGIAVTLGGMVAGPTPDGAHRLEMRRELTARVHHGAEADAVVEGTATANLLLANGETVAVRAELRLTDSTVTVTGRVEVDGRCAFARRWEESR
ncbi:CocE/NonD family hydrolase [Amycolatopsis sp.]|uniref:CocE/NonD family hydrolase n=1 Tax=Amycolatopsis sp. TaxID=37632 RepID=UPI002B8D8133|nr:CocE/NonD family hydrolase [Amycolatopsis sp.]HVV12143.1 CocE/NonD family hydrolase [Amycolatopsis sp.]